jgi:hypothetical protein
MNMTNKTLAAFLALAIIVSVAGTIISLNKLGKMGNIPTGAVAERSGKVSVTVSSLADITSISNVSFGSDSIISNTILTTSTVNPGAFADCNAAGDNACGGITIKNVGNVNVNVTMSSDKTAATLIGGTSPVFVYRVSNGNNSVADYTEVGDLAGCNLGFGTPCNYTNTSFNDAGCAVAVTNLTICKNLTFIDTNDTLRVEFNMTIPYDVAPAAMTSTFTFLGEQN